MLIDKYMQSIVIWMALTERNIIVVLWVTGIKFGILYLKIISVV